ncbi:hypothetical protein [Streptomyces noursei]|uniref:hypothetical protein n=1 Tax=Streptomyces noursei TaxID=1971 RepID=UPI001677A369|nr:hypothetical protein [Streptomyces noursei]MCZ1021076.1 hypothetical protein [Streptomyces noursei]GGX55593.1 hypothetical protein GCM10010341_90500 [Streptomyces noursei]
MSEIVEVPVPVDLIEADTTAANGYNFGVYQSSSYLKTRQQAFDWCAKNPKYKFADIPNDSWRKALAQIANGPLWIYAWQGNNYDNGNVQLHTNAQITATEDGSQQLGFVVQWSS